MSIYKEMKEDIPCPYCGSKKIRHLFPLDHSKPYFGIQCRKCRKVKRWVYKRKKTEMEQQSFYVILGMKNFGGDFIKSLAEALKHADMNNIKKIHDTWQEEWNKYYQMGLEITKQKDL